ncbi:DUF262 domain-containing protein [Nafulsella turpanensis]|uniref:DUF262 domain-containing protein n=1 Tax=Nafulsella turpanensis TaxID=1265690 RepID=UPI00034743F3|nr:DUF262 domain-containing protein [Nafulsella turpanensis]
MIATETSIPSTDTPFEINARSCTLLGPDGLLSQEYLVPIYQRPYSWGEEQIKRLLNSLLRAYREEEPYFLGTMQLMPAKKSAEAGRMEVVDGQQRLTTLLLLFKVIQLKYGIGTLPEPLQSFNWLSTKVSLNEQQERLDEALSQVTIPAPEELPEGQNTYLRSIVHISQLLDEFVVNEEQDIGFEAEELFFQFLEKKVYVVIIETRAGLSKTLDIFNTINTAGMDLNGGDVFKIRLFEYLRDFQGKPEEVFEDISALYAKIDSYKRGDISINSTLSIYKHTLIERANISRVTHGWGTHTFFERMFACLLLNENPGNYFNKERIHAALGENPLKELNELVDVQYCWKQEATIEDNTWHKLISWFSRYKRYHKLLFIYMHRFAEEGIDKVKFKEWRELLFRYYMIKTLQYRRVVNHAHTFTYHVIKKLLDTETTQDEAIAQIRQEIGAIDSNSFKKDCLLGNAYENAKQRYLMAWLLALLEEENWDDSAVHKTFFHRDYDVEHIRPRNPENRTAEDDVLWKNHLHSLGNLVLLERDLNRSKKVKHYDFKHKWKGYGQSKLKKVMRLRQENSDLNWNVDKCKIRTKIEADKLKDFLFKENLTQTYSTAN